ncbi:MAG: hypothetical protein U1E65_11375 [Myxococcota bacterium]
MKPLALCPALLLVACSTTVPMGVHDAGSATDGHDLDAEAIDIGFRDADPVEDAMVHPDATEADTGEPVDADAADMDALPQPDGSTPGMVELGTGRSMFMPLMTGDTVVPAEGPQGGGSAFGYNLPYGVKTRGMNPSQATLTFITFLASDHSEQARITLTFDLMPDGSGAYVFFGGAPPLMQCCDVANRDVVMRVEVTDMDGLTGADERQVHAGDCYAAGMDGAATMTSICH